MSEFDNLFDEIEVEEKPKKQKPKKQKPIETKVEYVDDGITLDELLGTKLERINFNKMTKDVLDFKIEKTPTIIKLMSVYEDLFGKTIRKSKLIINRAIIYNCLKLDKVLQEEEQKRKK